MLKLNLTDLPHLNELPPFVAQQLLKWKKYATLCESKVKSKSISNRHAKKWHAKGRRLSNLYCKLWYRFKPTDTFQTITFETPDPKDKKKTIKTTHGLVGSLVPLSGYNRRLRARWSIESVQDFENMPKNNDIYNDIYKSLGDTSKCFERPDL